MSQMAPRGVAQGRQAGGIRPNSGERTGSFPNLLRQPPRAPSGDADRRSPAWSRPLAPLPEWLREVERLIDELTRRDS